MWYLLTSAKEAALQAKYSAGLFFSSKYNQVPLTLKKVNLHSGTGTCPRWSLVYLHSINCSAETTFLTTKRQQITY